MSITVLIKFLTPKINKQEYKEQIHELKFLRDAGYLTRDEYLEASSKLKVLFELTGETLV